MSKNKVRKLLGNIVSNISSKEEKSLNIVNSLLPLLKKYHVIAFYAAMEQEVNLDHLIELFLEEGKTILLPKMDKEDISFYQINNIDDLQTSDDNYQIREPRPVNLYHKNNIDAILVPGLGFDNKGYRLGHGKGYYDRYLKDYRGVTIGVCFKEQILKSIPHDDNDIKVGMLVFDE